MSAPIKLNLKVYQGSTFKQMLRWESSTKVYVPITSISKAAPMVVTAAGHNIPVGWRARISNAGGMKEVIPLEYQTVTSTTDDTATFNQINSLGFTTYTSGGVLEYNQPASITGLKARMQIRAKVTSVEILHELTTENGGVVFDNLYKTITLTIPDEITAQLNFISAVYLLEFESIVTGEVSPFAKGTVSLEKEVTR